MKVLGRELVAPFNVFWEQYKGDISVPAEYIEEGHSIVFGNGGYDRTAPELPRWASLPDDDLSYHVAHELTHIIQRDQGYPQTLRGKQYPPDSPEARMGGDLEEMIFHPPLDEMLYKIGFKNDFIRKRMFNGALKGVSESPIPAYGSHWFFTWAFRYCELQIDLERSDWLQLEDIYRARAPEVCKLGEELVAIIRAVGWGTREQALETILRVRDTLGFKVNEIVLVLDPVSGEIL